MVEADQDIFLLVHYNPTRGKIPILSPAAPALVEEPLSQDAAGGVWRAGGVAATRTALGGCLGYPSTRHMVMDRQGIPGDCRGVRPGGVHLGEELSLSPDAGGVVLSAGRQRLDGSALLRLMEYQGYDGGEPSRIKAIAGLAAAAVQSEIGTGQRGPGGDLFRKAVNQMKTDLSFVDFDARLSSARMMAELKASPARVIPTEGPVQSNPRICSP